jgi:hypothetical protein
MAEEKPTEEKKPEEDKKKEDFMNAKWRPAMGWMYMTVCAFDFVVFPIMFTIVQFWETEAANDAFRQWQPLTLAGAGLFHMAMGAVLGIAAYGRTQEKLGGANNGGLQSNTPALGSSGFSATSPAPGTNSFGSQPLTGGFSASSTGPGAFASSSMPMNDPGGIVVGPGGKPGPAPLPDPIR